MVSTIAYTAFLAGPPLLGFVADQVGTLKALLVVAVLLIPSALVVPSARPPGPTPTRDAGPPKCAIVRAECVFSSAEASQIAHRGVTLRSAER